MASEFGKEDDLSGAGLISYFFQLIGKALYIDAVEQPVAPPPNQDYNTGEILFAKTSGNNTSLCSNYLLELVMLMRFLLSESSWSAVLTESISSSLRLIPSLVDVEMSSVRSNADKRSIWCALAALCVIGSSYYIVKLRSPGGDLDPVVSTGGRIQIQSTKEKGTVADCDRLSATTKVILDNDPGKVVECSMDKLVAIPEVNITQQSNW